MRRILIYLSIGAITLFDLYRAFLCWLFKDGLGPDMIESHGMTAFLRFAEDFGPLFLESVILMGILILFLPPQSKVKLD